MGVVTYEMEVATSIPPAKLFKAIVLDGGNLFPKVLPQAIKSSELLEGDGGPGSIKKITFGEGSQFKYEKHRVDGIDKENLSYSYSVIEADDFMNKIEKINYDTKFVAGADGGSVCKSTIKYYTIGDFEIKDEHIKAVEEKALGMVKVVEAYLLANPDAYN